MPGRHLASHTQHQNARAADRYRHVPVHRHRGVDQAAPVARRGMAGDPGSTPGAPAGRPSRRRVASRWGPRETPSSSRFPTAPGAVAAALAAQRALAARAVAGRCRGPGPDGHAYRRCQLRHRGLRRTPRSSRQPHRQRRARRPGAPLRHDALPGQAKRSRRASSSETSGSIGSRISSGRSGSGSSLWGISRATFAPIASLDAVPNNLPTRLTTFLGRSREIGEITALLADNRLLTLTGPGGTGKTRLSLEVAGRSLGTFPQGVFFVELAPITEPELVPATIGQALGLPERGGRSSIDRLIDHIGERRMLLVLDNFEQVTDAAPSVNALLAACPNLVVLASSRSILHVSGEQEYPVPPLGLPDPAHLPPLTQLSQFEAVALFIERARAVKPDFDVTNDNAPAVAEICVRLDGLPLAIELAAARIRIFTPAGDARAGSRTASGCSPAAPATCPNGSRRCAARSPGATTCSTSRRQGAVRVPVRCSSAAAGLEAVEHVCGREVAGDVLDALGSLVEKSLVRQSEGIGGEPRFGMLGTIREFALEQATARGGREDLRAATRRAVRHAGRGLGASGDGGRQGRDAGPDRAGSRQPACRHRMGDRDRRGRRGAAAGIGAVAVLADARIPAGGSRATRADPGAAAEPRPSRTAGRCARRHGRRRLLAGRRRSRPRALRAGDRGAPGA